MPAKGTIIEQWKVLNPICRINEITGLSRCLTEAWATRNLCNITKSGLNVGDDSRDAASPSLPMHSRTCKGQLKLGARMESSAESQSQWWPSESPGEPILSVSAGNSTLAIPQPLDITVMLCLFPCYTTRPYSSMGSHAMTERDDYTITRQITLHTRDREMAQRLRVLKLHKKSPGSVPSTRIKHLASTCNSSLRRSDAVLFWPLSMGAAGSWYTYVHVGKHPPLMKQKEEFLHTPSLTFLNECSSDGLWGKQGCEEGSGFKFFPIRYYQDLKDVKVGKWYRLT